MGVGKSIQEKILADEYKDKRFNVDTKQSCKSKIPNDVSRLWKVLNEFIAF